MRKISNKLSFLFLAVSMLTGVCAKVPELFTAAGAGNADR